MNDDEKKIYQFQLLQASIEEIKKRLQVVLKSLEELEISKRSLQDIRSLKKTDAMIPIGSGNFVKGRVNDVEKVMMDIGSGIFVEKSLNQALELTEERIEEVKKVLTNLTAQEQMMQNELAKLQPEIQKMMMR